MSAIETKPPKIKKRKERPSDATPDQQLVRKKSKHHDKHKHKSKHDGDVDADIQPTTRKGKGKALESDESDFVVVSASVRVTIPPLFSSDPRAGVEEMLDSLVMKHIPSLKGVVLSHHNLNFIETTARIQNDCPFMVCHVGFDATVWSPRIGSTLVGKVNLYSPDHISLLVHRTFNVSIPQRHIPPNEYFFQYGPAENDPEFGADSYNWELPSLPKATDQMDLDTMEIDDAGSSSPKRWVDPENSAEMVESVGRWVQGSPRMKVGGESGMVRFTVVGMTLANQMISLIGSLQPDPFNPLHSEPSPTTAAITNPPVTVDDDVEIVPNAVGEEPKKKKRKKVKIVEDDAAAADKPKKRKSKKKVPPAEST